MTESSKLPKVVGPYSLATTAGGLIFCAGQIGVDPTTGEFAPGGIAEQTRQTLTNVKAVLDSVGSNISAVIKCDVFLANMADYAAFNEEYAKHFTTDPMPARTTVAVASLPRNALVEIACTAKSNLN